MSICYLKLRIDLLYLGVDDIGCFDDYQDFIKLNKWIFSGGILNKVSEEEPMSIDTLQNDLILDNLSISEPETVTDNQLQMALPVDQASVNNSFIPSSFGVEQQLNAYQMQPYYPDLQAANPSIPNMYDAYNSDQISSGANNGQKPGFVQGVKNYFWK